MPRRRSSDAASNPKKTRTRTGCLTCRLKKVKCDEVKPVCTRCQRRGLDCHVETQLKWEDEFAQRGLTFGRQGVWGKAGVASGSAQSPTAVDGATGIWCPIPRIEPHQFVNSTSDDVRSVLLLHNRTPIPTDTVQGAREGGSRSPDQSNLFRVLPSHLFNPLQQRDHSYYAIQQSSEYSGFPRDSGVLFEDSNGRRIIPAPYSLTDRGYGGISFVIDSPLSPQPALSPFQDLEELHKFELLGFYLQKFCPLTTASSTHESPFSSVVMPFAVSSSKITLNAILAVAACLRTQFEPCWTQTALKLKHRAIKELRAHIALTTVPNSLQSLEALVVMLLLCMFEIISKSDQDWVVHLRGARDLIELRRQHPLLRAPNEVEAFAERFFAFQDVIGRTACGDVPKFGRDYWDGDVNEVDSWMGCSPRLARILSAVTELSRRRQQKPEVAEEKRFALEARQLEHDLDNLQQIVSNLEETTLARSAELKRLSAIVYLHCALNHATPSTPLIKELVQKILTLLAFFLDRREMAGMTWPIFVAAVELDPLNEDVLIDHPEPTIINGRKYVLEALDSSVSTAVTNTSRTQDVIAKVWNARDMATTIDDRNFDWRNDWELYVAPFCGNLSLA